MKDLAKIYIVEDDATIISLLTSHLQKDYQVLGVSNFRDIKEEILSYKPDLILMDITLPFFNGFYWTTEIRKHVTTPIIFISSSNDEMDAVMALNMGGDDYITKPFSLTILDAKITAFLRRANQFANDSLSYKGYHLHFDGSLTKEDQKIFLSPTEHKILSLLLTNQESVVSKEKLLRTLWESDQFIDQNTLNVNMTRLRKNYQILILIISIQ
ncbi:response regulator protein [Streptococcus pseudoporcinus]|uniref:Response regulator protein n=1 Tax=Streptococcus pseudoporcinus TaxID=361101 RepID=A0A4U9XM63_9STRE|nr:response regulator protein [Streptococcus pseudoporcinus]VUC67256.1 response regulator protein [Streptococcus pseudoporcinus]VUC98184.1 response regulator protein [Streptococcus pseudoporcinus]VUC98575.1 response regulator protein [Streptococcus pseudoporcinus]